MHILVSFFAAIFDMFILYIYVKETLRNKKEKFSIPFTLLCFTVAEGILCINSVLSSGNSSIPKQLITVFISFITTFLITFLYHANLIHRFFISISYIVYTIVGESLFAILLAHQCHLVNFHMHIIKFITKRV